MFILTEPEVVYVNSNLIRMGSLFFRQALQLDSLAEVKTFLRKQLEKNQVYLAVKSSNCYKIYQQSTGERNSRPIVSAPIISAEASLKADASKHSAATGSTAAKTLYYRGQPYQKPTTDSATVVDPTPVRSRLRYRGVEQK